MSSQIIQAIEAVAKTLGTLSSQVIFTGGSSIPLYMDNPNLWTARPTDDVDCVVEISTYSEYARLQKKLRALGFRDCVENYAPLCRMLLNNLHVDFIPTGRGVLKFSNPWHKEGFNHSFSVHLQNGISIRLFDLPYFLASKWSAFLGRGRGDFLASHDLEDIISLIEGVSDLPKVSQGSLKSFLKTNFKALLKNPSADEILSAHLGFNAAPVQIDIIAKKITAWLK